MLVIFSSSHAEIVRQLESRRLVLFLFPASEDPYSKSRTVEIPYTVDVTAEVGGIHFRAEEHPHPHPYRRRFSVPAILQDL